MHKIQAALGNFLRQCRDLAASNPRPALRGATPGPVAAAGGRQSCASVGQISRTLKGVFHTSKNVAPARSRSVNHLFPAKDLKGRRLRQAPLAKPHRVLVNLPTDVEAVYSCCDPDADRRRTDVLIVEGEKCADVAAGFPTVSDAGPDGEGDR